jgi:hypothetical protein
VSRLATVIAPTFDENARIAGSVIRVPVGNGCLSW